MTEPFQSSEIDLIAAALRADMADVEMMVDSLASKLKAILPASMIEVTTQRSMADRIAKRPGHASALRVVFPDRELRFEKSGGGLKCQINQVVRGVAISRRQTTLSESLEVLAAEISTLAASSEAARAALARIIE